jgi:hypothetical protein
MHPHASNFSQLVDSIFGSGSCRLNLHTQSTNTVLGALASPTDFQTFQNNFRARLSRLESSYRNHMSREALLTQVTLVADSRNWQGAVAELAAYDLFNSKRDFLCESPKLDMSIDVNDSLGRYLGMQEANLDIYFEDFQVYSDIKVLKDNVSEILNGIRKQVLPDRTPLVTFEYSRDIGYELVQDKRQQILQTLRNSLNGGRQPSEISFNAEVPGLVARLDWSRGMLLTESAYSPFRHAEELHKLPFHHAKKFLTSQPFFLTFVVFPWFNNVINDFCDSNAIFYRAFARRAFCQYKADSVEFKTWMPHYTGPESISEVSKHLGGILFIEDHSIAGIDPGDTNTKSFYFENPNATLRPSNTAIDSYLRQIATATYDDFSHDNY